MNIQECFLLASERSIGKILCGGRRTHSERHIVVSAGNLFVGFFNGAFQFGLEWGLDDGVSDFFSGFCQCDYVVYVELV